MATAAVVTTSGRSGAGLRAVLRVIGTTSLFALVFVAAPRSWMRDVHVWLGMGELPNAPVVWYLARSTSAFYALVGGLFWVVSFDLHGQRRVVTYLGWAITSLGVALLVIDWAEGLPRFWAVWEGPFVMAVGIVMLALNRRLTNDPVR